MVILLFIGWLVLARILSSVVGILYNIIFIGEYLYYPLKETHPNLALLLLVVALLLMIAIPLSFPLWWM